MVNISMQLEDDSHVAHVYMCAPPAKGDILWLVPAGNRQSAYEVLQVCHWVSDESEYHAVCAYVQPVERAS